MRTPAPRRVIVCGLFTVPTFLLLFAAVGPRPAETAQAPQCPAPTVRRGSQCVLTQDAQLDKTLRLTSDTKLNCQGRRLTPKTTGTSLTQRSAPEVAIFLNGVRNVQIQDCVIDGFDFGIFAIKSKVPAAIKNNPGQLAQRRNKILQNTVNARFLAVALAAVDNTEVKDNTVKFTTAGGKGVYVGRDSDLNRISNNTITGDIASATSQAVGAPGPVSASTNPAVPAGQAVLVTQTLAPDPALLNSIIEGELHQLPIASSPVLNADFSEDNLVEGNTVSFTQTPLDGVATAATLRTTVWGNTVRNSLLAIRAGIQSGATGLPKKFHGGCTSPAGRLCLADADCNILGTTGGACSAPAPPTVPVFWVSDGFLVEGNTILAPFNRGIATTGSNTVIRGNTITGPSPQGISLAAKFAMETSTVTRNTVSNVAVALLLTNKATAAPGLEAAAFGARVSLNDFTGYTTSVSSDMAATLSANGQGNFWGLPCPLGFDPATVQRVGGLPAGAVVADDHPYGVPVAKTPAASLPKPCR